MNKIKLAPSILTADFSNLASQVRLLEQGGADYLHLDVMDGRFVPNLTFGPLIVSSLRKSTWLPFDIHLMVEEPERFLEAFAGAGAQILTVHAETCPHLHRIVQSIKEMGLRAGVALNPATPLHILDYVLDDVDLVLLMTVNPGWGGQAYIPGMCRKINELRRMISTTQREIDLQVDGGINDKTLEAVITAGANFLVIGSALFREGDPAGALRACRERAEAWFVEGVDGFKL